MCDLGFGNWTELALFSVFRLVSNRNSIKTVSNKKYCFLTLVNIFSANIFYYPNFFSANIFLPNFFSTQNCFLIKCFFDQNNFRLNFFYNIFFTQICVTLDSDSKFGIQDLGPGIRDLGFRIWDLGPRPFLTNWPFLPIGCGPAL